MTFPHSAISNCQIHAQNFCDAALAETAAHGLVDELATEIASIPCINSHSHLDSEAERLANPMDALLFFQHAYPRADLASAGMSAQDMDLAFDPQQPLGERWAA